MSKTTPCDHGECPYDAMYINACRYYCGLGVDEDEEDDYEDEEEYVPSSSNGDYGPSNPWDAPGCSIDMFIRGVK
jgi:hypothetical protein